MVPITGAATGASCDHGWGKEPAQHSCGSQEMIVFIRVPLGPHSEPFVMRFWVGVAERGQRRGERPLPGLINPDSIPVSIPTHSTIHRAVANDHDKVVDLVMCKT
jgi:hypothetical protein